jgi:hypothetical protein
MEIRFMGDDPVPPKPGEYLRERDGSIYRVASFRPDTEARPKTVGVLKMDPVEEAPLGARVIDFAHVPGTGKLR